MLQLLFLLVHPFLPCVTSEQHYQRLAATSTQDITSAATATYVAADATDWQPMQNNWIILQTSPTQTQPRRRRYPYSSSGSFNHSGNYQPEKYVPLKKVKANDDPYVLTISKVPDSSSSSNDFYATPTARRTYSMPSKSVGNKYHRHIFDIVQQKKTAKLSTTPDIDKDIEKNMLHISEATAMPTVTSVNVDTSDSSAADSSAENELEQNFSDFLVPLENAIDKVKHFCDLVKNVISSDTDDDELSSSSLLPNDDVVQGRANVINTPKKSQTKSSSSSSLAGTGRKSKKLKKKFKKFLLPLLLAYKLKFLTLIPVLIGGLTLLVGSTGLAGFFFALFTAVMSLRSSVGGKTVVVKKM